jgi:hypothetical protein
LNALVISLIILADEEYKILLSVVVDKYVAVLHEGAEAPDNNTFDVLFGLLSIANDVVVEYTIPPTLAVKLADVPPCDNDTFVPDHIPVVIVPNLVILVCTLSGKVL